MLLINLISAFVVSATFAHQNKAYLAIFDLVFHGESLLDHTDLLEQPNSLDFLLDCFRNPLFLNSWLEDFKTYIDPSKNPERFYNLGIPLALGLAKGEGVFWQEYSLLLFEEAYTDQQALDLLLAVSSVEMAKFIRKHPFLFKRALLYGPEAMKKHLSRNCATEFVLCLTCHGYSLMESEWNFSQYIHSLISDHILDKDKLVLVCSYPGNIESLNRNTALLVINTLLSLVKRSPSEFDMFSTEFKGIGSFLRNALLSEEEKLELFRSYGTLFPFISTYLPVEPRLLEAIPKEDRIVIDMDLQPALFCPLGHYFLARYRPECPSKTDKYLTMPFQVVYSLALFCPRQPEAWIYDVINVKRQPLYLLDFIESIPEIYKRRFERKGRRESIPVEDGYDFLLRNSDDDSQPSQGFPASPTIFASLCTESDEEQDDSYFWPSGDEQWPFRSEIEHNKGDKERFIKMQLEYQWSDPRFFFAFAHCTEDLNIANAFFEKTIKLNRWDCALAVGHSLILKGRKLAPNLTKFFIDNGKFKAAEELIFVHSIPQHHFMVFAFTPIQLTVFDRAYGPCLQIESLRSSSGLVLVQIARLLISPSTAKVVRRILSQMGSWSAFRILYILHHLPSLLDSTP